MLSKPMATKLAHDLYELAGDKNFLAEAKFLLELAEKHREGALPAILLFQCHGLLSKRSRYQAC